VFVTRTFLFWDLEGSTRAWEADADRTGAIVVAWEAMGRQVVAENGGDLFKLVGDGGCAAFESAGAAVHAAVSMQRAMAASPMQARMGLYSGEAERRDTDWFGVPLNRCARLTSLGHGGQILLAGTTAGLVPEGSWTLLDLGVHVLRDVADPIVVHQVVADGLPEEFPALRSEVRTVSLPAVRDRLVGRDADVAGTVDTLRRHRLVTLTGVGGTGKTRLAVAAAREASNDFELTVFADLSPLAHPSLVPAAVAEALDVVTSGREASAGLVAEFLGRRNALIVLDNAEHVLDAAADLVEELLDRASGTRLLVTSREPLGIASERVVRVRSLDPETTAAELFRERLGAPADDAVVVELCHHLDGIPLAIELAAARARALGVKEVLSNLGDRFRLLTGGRRASGRQATLHAALEWSHQLLEPVEQQLLRRLAVFAGGFTPAAVEEVCAPLDGVPVRTVLAALVDKSLVVFDDEAERHRLLETVRLFAHEHLVAAGEVECYRDRHVDWIRCAILAAPSAGTTAMFPFVAEAPNLRAAADWLLANERHAAAAVVLSRSAGVWHYLMQDAEVAPLLEAAFERAAGELSICEQAMVCSALNSITPASDLHWARRGVEIDPAHECFAGRSSAAFLAAARARTDPLGALDAIERLRSLPGGLNEEAMLLTRVVESQVRFLLGDDDGADATLARVLADPQSLFSATVLTILVALRAVRGDVDGARAVLRALEADPHIGVRMGPIAMVEARVHLDVAAGRPGAAAAGVRQLEALRERRFFLHPAADHYWFNGAADLAAAGGDLDRAARLAAGALSVRSVETHVFTAVGLQRRHGDDPRWTAAAATPPTVEECRELARAVGRQ
jgi:predicted ATPase/class 3 adenylate cyclase